MILVAALALPSCAGVDPNVWVEPTPRPATSGALLNITGTVHHLDLEGGLFVVRDEAGTQYNVSNLPDAFRVEGMMVEAEARRRENVASIGMVGPLVDLLRIRKRPGAESGVVKLVGTKWRLEDLVGAGVMDRVQATLAFTEEGKVSGNGSCNQFFGTVMLDGGTITFGPLATTRKSCGEAVMNQEHQYLAVLRAAQRFEIKEPFLYLFAKDRAQPLRLIRTTE